MFYSYSRPYDVPASRMWVYGAMVAFAFPLAWFLAWAFLTLTTRLAARLSAWESAYRGLRLPLPVVTRALHYHRSEEHTSELQSPCNLVCRLLLEKTKDIYAR